MDLAFLDIPRGTWDPPADRALALRFYHIPRKAGGPVVPVAFDYGRRECRIGPATELSSDPEIDLLVFRPFYPRVTPKHPEKFAPIRFRTQEPPGSA